MSRSLPDDNVFGFSKTFGDVFDTFNGLIMYGLTELIIPKMARWFLEEVAIEKDKEARDTHVTRLILFANNLIMIIIPALVTLLLSEDCMRGWHSLWSTCEDPANFDINITLVSPALVVPAKVCLDNHCSTSTKVINAGSTVAETHLPVTFHSDICSPTTQLTGRCSRTVVQSISNLVTDKLIVSAFVSSFSGIMLQTEMGLYVKHGVKNILTGRAWSNPRQADINLAIEMGSMVMLLEYCFLLGVMNPIILPLACLNMGLKAIKLNDAITQGRYEILGNPRPSIQYLAFALLLDYMVLVWIFVSNDMHGKVLLIVGPLVMVVVVLLIEWHTPTWRASWGDLFVYNQPLTRGISLKRRTREPKIGQDGENDITFTPNAIAEEAVDERSGRNQEQHQIENEGVREEQVLDDGGGVSLPMAQIQMQNLGHVLTT